MNHHLWILQQRIQAVALGGDGTYCLTKRPRGKIDQQEEENLYAGNDDRSVRKKTLVRLVSKPQHESVGGQQK